MKTKTRRRKHVVRKTRPVKEKRENDTLSSNEKENTLYYLETFERQPQEGAKDPGRCAAERKSAQQHDPLPPHEPTPFVPVEPETPSPGVPETPAPGPEPSPAPEAPPINPPQGKAA